MIVGLALQKEQVERLQKLVAEKIQNSAGVSSILHILGGDAHSTTRQVASAIDDDIDELNELRVQMELAINLAEGKTTMTGEPRIEYVDLPVLDTALVRKIDGTE